MQEYPQNQEIKLNIIHKNNTIVNILKEITKKNKK